MTDRPNVLFVHTDEQRADTLGCYDNDVVSTPHLDGLARDGVCFEEGHCTHPLCTPARGTLLTGRYPSAHGSWRNGVPLPESEVTVAELLRDAGYATGLLGKAHFGPYHGDPDVHPESVQTSAVDPSDCWDFWRDFDGPYYGFDHVELAIGHGDNGIQGGHYGLWLEEHHPEVRPRFAQSAALDDTDPAYESWASAVPVEAHSTTWVADRTEAFVAEHAGERPFFGWIGIPDPHFPYDPPAPYWERYDPDDVTVPGDPEGRLWGEDPPRHVEYHLAEKYGVDWRTVPPAKRREIVANYYAMVDLVDDAVGRILGALEAHGVADETVVVFTSDHGDWLGEHGLFQKGVPHTRGLTRVPWLVRWPGVTRPGRRVESVASHVDLVPTLLDAAGVEVPHGVQGESLRPVLRGERDRLRPFALVEHRHEPYRAGRGLAAEADDASAAALRDSLVNWGERDLHVHTVYTDDYRYSHVTGLDEPYGELVDLTGDPAARTDRWSPDPADRAAQLEQLAAALVHAQDPHEERRYPV